MELSGQTVVVTGASGGIGASFAHALAARGANVVAVARSGDKLQQLADDITRAHPGVRVDPVSLDLTDPTAGEQLEHRLGELGLRIDGLINNAGSGGNGPFVDIGLAKSLTQVDLDVRAVVELTARFFPAMVQRRSGWIVNVGSTAGFQPTPTQAVYGACKAFVRSFTEALWFEAKPAGVRVFAVAPGGVETGFFDAAGAQFLTKGRLSPDEVATFTLDRLDGTGPMVVPGFKNRFGTLGSRFAPQRLLIRVSARIVKPG